MWFSTFLAALLTFGTFALCALLTVVAGDICWPPRLGAVLVGGAVFLQGFIFADPDRFTRKLRSGITLQQRIMHISFTAAVFGTLFGALGDLMPSIYGVAVCTTR
ncbi:hypothetical protein CSC75_01180 [Pseudoxanthomonas wuyuanensis]|nr:hypothetical protein CSC75_01180 [Pseudoxanthomonas wuyuanensis]